jgi:hypothetical protein
LASAVLDGEDTSGFVGHDGQIDLHPPRVLLPEKARVRGFRMAWTPKNTTLPAHGIGERARTVG